MFLPLLNETPIIAKPVRSLKKAKKCIRAHWKQRVKERNRLKKIAEKQQKAVKIKYPSVPPEYLASRVKNILVESDSSKYQPPDIEVLRKRLADRLKEKKVKAAMETEQAKVRHKLSIRL